MKLSNRFAYKVKVNQFLVSQEDEIFEDIYNLSMNHGRNRVPVVGRLGLFGRFNIQKARIIHPIIGTNNKINPITPMFKPNLKIPITTLKLKTVYRMAY